MVVRLNYFKNNLKVIKSLIKKNTKILIPVKCNAYGFGLLPVSRWLEQERIDYLGVAFPFEGIYLRKNNIESPILVFSEIVYPEDYDHVIKYKLIPTIFTHHSLDQFNERAMRKNIILPVHIKIDTGMGRNGVPFSNAMEFIHHAFLKKNLKVEGLYSHLSSADEPAGDFTRKQIAQFEIIINQLKREKIFIPVIHLLNSAGVIHYPNSSCTMVRPGIMFYGYFPDNKILKNINLKQGGTLQSKISYIKQAERYMPISYNHTYYTKNKAVIATVSFGYGDGFNRLLSNHHHVLYKDQLNPIRGRICMDQFMVDVSQMKNVKQGDWITIFGADKKNEIRLESITSRLKTIPYEILCNIGNRVERIYLP